MVSLFDRIRILLSRNVDAGGKTEPIVSPPEEVQAMELPNNEAYYDFLRGASEPQEQIETADAQELKPNHASELEHLKHFAELAKQNKLDSAALNEDLE
jgi:hypothetical protein